MKLVIKSQLGLRSPQKLVVVDRSSFLLCYCMYRYVTVDPDIMCNYNALIKNVKRIHILVTVGLRYVMFSLC